MHTFYTLQGEETMEETPLQMAHRLQRSRMKSCKAKAGKLTSMEANPAINNVRAFTYEAHVWKEPGITARLRRGLFDADAKVAFKTVHTLCIPSEMVVVDEGGTCGYLVGIEPAVAPGLVLDHLLLTNGLVLPDLANSTILLAQQPSLEVDFLGRIKKLDVELSPLSDAGVGALFRERYAAFSEVQISCLPFQFDQSAKSRRPSVQRLNLPTRGEAESLTEQETTEDMVYGRLDGDGDALGTPPSSTISTPVLRPVRPDDFNIDLLPVKYRT
ncbi:hypothetical protein FRC04_007881 [Tulasnella sp. 424]|nr:hypothetical protein FRC04_007881 [Tulasnella sp. 424]